MAGRRMYSEAEFASAVKEAVAEKKAAQDELMAPIRTELDRMTDAIDSANHLKTTLGEKLDEVQRLQEETNSKLQHHIDTTRQLRREFGVDTMSLEQKQALPAVLGQAVDDGKRKGLLHNRFVQAGLVITVVFQAIGIAAGLYNAFFGAAHPLKFWP